MGKVRGREASSPGGLGSWAVDVGDHRVGALAVVNALGDVRDRQGRIIAGALGPDGEFLDSSGLLRGAVAAGDELGPLAAGANTTLALVGTDAPLSQVDLVRVARIAANAFARCVTPVHTPFDGDVLVAASTAPDVTESTGAAVLSLGAAAQHVVEEAILRAVGGGGEA